MKAIKQYKHLISTNDTVIKKRKEQRKGNAKTNKRR